MVRLSIITLSLGMVLNSTAQDGKLMAYEVRRSYVQPGLLAASATFSPATMLNRSATNYYLSGFASYRLDNRVSLRSDNYFFVNSSNDDPFVQQAFRSYFGGFFHFRKPSSFSNWDNYIGFQPGITYMKRNPYHGGINSLAIIEERGQISPSFAITLGTSFYVWKYFHFFANLTYANSKLGAVENGPYKTDEIIFSAGLGFQIQTKKSDFK